MIRLEPMPCSIARLVRSGRASTAVRRRSAGLRPRRRIGERDSGHAPGPRGGAWDRRRRGRSGRGERGRGGLPGRGVRRRGHAFPAIALARALRRRGATRWWSRPGSKWREAVEADGPGFRAAEEYKAFPPPPPDSAEGAAAADAARGSCRCWRSSSPDVVVSDILTLAPALAAERAGAAPGDADPPRLSGARAGAAVLRLRGAAAANARRAGAWRAAEAGAGRRGCGAAAGDERDAGGGRPAAGGSAPRRDERASWRWWRPSRSSSTRGAGRRSARDGADGVRAPYEDVEVPAGDGAAGAGGAEHGAGPGLRLVRSRWRRWRRAGAGGGDDERRQGGPLPEAPANAVVVDGCRTRR